MKEYKKLQEKGITLIALVVTIILLLILVGVTISQILGENGLIRKTKEAVEKYKNASEEEQIQLGQLEQYVTDFSIVGGNEGENKALISIKELEVTADTETQQIKVKVTVIGESSGIEYKINSEEEWIKKENEGTVKEEKGEKETEYTHTFEGLEIGKSYYVRVKVYDTNGKYEEAISDVVTLGYIMTAEDEDVLKGRTYIGKTGTKSTGTMANNGPINETLNFGESITIPAGYTSGGKITSEELNNNNFQVSGLDIMAEDRNINWSWTATNIGTLIVTLTNTHGGGGTLGSCYCRKNGVNVSASKSHVDDARVIYSYIFDVSVGDQIAVYANCSGTWGDHSFSVIFFK